MTQASNWGVPESGPVDPVTMAQRINASMDAGLSLHRGGSRPGYAVGGTLWVYDGAMPWQLRLYTGSQDLTLGTINTTTGKWESWSLGGAVGLKSAVVGATHDVSVTGSQAVTGVGFAPSVVLAFATIAGQSSRTSWGFAVNGAAFSMFDNSVSVSDSYNWSLSDLIYLRLSGTPADAYAVLTSLDADGFTLSWSKTGSPTGTAKLMFLVLA